eukprot:TRINITY_DN10208_c0_g1_i1.p1 TRINITY_DN10208_c0_g1~~TRINITY_DN10208_c0_g1_i1.p1  ORF type:complete len:278 (+),score=66.64 TRINITY_DN10208_c0_g1_i1:267-1100(+)
MALRKYEALNKKPSNGFTKNHGLNMTFVDSSHSRAKSIKQVSHSHSNEHAQNVIEMEKIVKQYKGKRRLEIFSALFDEIIRVDPHYGKILKEVKREYDAFKEDCSLDCKKWEKEVVILKNENAKLQKELFQTKTMNLYLEKQGVRSLNVDAAKENKSLLERSPMEERLNLMEERLNAIENKANLAKTKKASRNKSVNVPRLDLSKIKSKYVDQQVAIAPSKTLAVPSNSHYGGILNENTIVLNMPNYDSMNWKERTSYLDICKKNMHSNGIPFKFKN